MGPQAPAIDVLALRMLPLTTRAALVPSSANASKRTVEVTWSTGAEVTRRDVWTGERFTEVLSMEPKHVRLDRLNQGAPVLDSHRSSNVASVIGVVDWARIVGGAGLASVRFSSRAEVDPVWHDVKSGILRSVSVGYAVHKWNVTRASNGQLEKRTAVDWEPFELSIVTIAADAGAQVRALDGTDTDPVGDAIRAFNALHSG